MLSVRLEGILGYDRGKRGKERKANEMPFNA